MAELTRPNFNIQRQIQQVRPGTERAIGPSQVPNTYNVVSDAFSKMVDHLGTHIALQEQSQKTSDRLQAKNIMMEKTKHHNNLKNTLAVELGNTSPEHLSLSTVLEKLKSRDIDGKTKFNIGKNLDVNISPMSLPENLSDSVREQVEDHFINEDQDLLSAILKGVETVSSNYDTTYLNFEHSNFRQKIKQTFKLADTTDQAKSGGGQLLENMVNSILERSNEGGTLDQNEINTWVNKSAQTILEEWYIRELRDQNVSRDEVIDRAERGYYSIEFKDKKHSLSSNFFNADILRRSDRDERKREEDRKKQEELVRNNLKASYIYEWGGANFKGFEQAVKDLELLKVPRYEAIKWASQQEALIQERTITNTENEIWSQSEFNKSYLNKFTNATNIKDKYGRTKIVSKKGKDLTEAVKKAFPDVSEKDLKYITEGFITRLITAHEKETQQEAVKDLDTKQKTLMSKLLTMAGQDFESAKILKRFYSQNHNGSWELSNKLVQEDKELAAVFGREPKYLNQKLHALGPIGRQAINNHINAQKRFQGSIITDSEHQNNLTSIANEYNINVDSALKEAFKDSTLRPEYADQYEDASDQLGEQWITKRNSLQGKKPTTEQLLDYHIFEDQLDSMLKIGQNIRNMHTEDLKDALIVLDGEGSEYDDNARINPIKNKIISAIKARQTELAVMPAYLAIKETGQEHKFNNGEKIDVDKIIKWQKDHKAGKISNLIPATVLEKVKGLTNVKIPKEERLATYTGLIGVSKQFGNDDQQRIAFGQLRRHIKQDANPALAALTDNWDDMSSEATTPEIFNIVTNIDPQTLTDLPGTSTTSDATFSEIKQALQDRGKTIGIKSTMADESQIHDHIALERAIIRSRASTSYYDEMSKDDISDQLADQLYPHTYVVKTGQRYNFAVDKRAFEAIGLDAKSDALRGYKFYMQEFERSGTGEWALIPNMPEGMLEQLRDQAIDSAMLVGTPQGSRRYREGGRFYEEDAQGNKKEIFNDYWSQLQEQTLEKTLEDIIKGNSKNLKKGFINSKDGFNMAVYLLPNSGNENQAALLGTFLQKDKSGNKVPKQITQQDLASASASAYVLDWMMGAKFASLFSHDYVRTLEKEGKERIRKDTMNDRISSIPFLRFLESPGKLEFDHGILPLLDMLNDEAKRLGVETLKQPQANLILKKFIAQQDRWYKSDWMPDIMEPFFETFSNFPYHGLPQGKINE